MMACRRKTVYLKRAAAVLAAVLLAAVAVYGQEREGGKPACANCLRVANQVDLAADLARLDGMVKQGRWEELVVSFDRLLERTEGKLVQGAAGVFTGAGKFLRERMVRLGPQARETYRIQHDRAAGRAYEAAARALDEKQLERMVWEYPLSSFTDDALGLLASIKAERGNFQEAVSLLERLYSWCPDTNLSRGAILIRAAWYSFYAGNHARARAYLEKVRSDDGARLETAVKLRLSQLMERLRRGKSPWKTVPEREYMAGVPGGGFDRAGTPAEVAPAGSISWQGDLMEGPGAGRWSNRRALRHNERRRAAAPPGDDYRYQSVVYDGKVYAGTEVGVGVFDLGTGRLLMRLEAPRGGEFFPGLDSYLAPTVTEDFVYANFVHEVSKSEDYSGILIKAALPRYTLCAFDRRTGKLKWTLHTGRKFRKHFSGKWFSVPSAPVFLEGMLIVEVKTRGQLAGSHVAAFDGATGEMKWVTPLCSNGTELTMFGYDARGPLSTMLACSKEAGQTVYCCTNLGAVFALDARNGAVRWAGAYDQIPLRAARHYYAQMRNIVWRNSTPVVSEGVLVVAPLDSHKLYAFDCATGKMLWRVSHSWQKAQFRYLLGVADGKVVLAGSRLAALGLRTGKVKWLSEPFSVARSGGRGLVTPSQVVVPRSDGIYRFSLEKGELLGTDDWVAAGPRTQAPRPRRGLSRPGTGSSPVGRLSPGNLLETDGRLVVTGRSKVTVYKKSLEK